MPRNSLIRLVTADLNERTIVGNEPDVGLPNRSFIAVGARRAVPLLLHLLVHKVDNRYTANDEGDGHNL